MVVVGQFNRGNFGDGGLFVVRGNLYLEHLSRVASALRLDVPALHGCRNCCRRRRVKNFVARQNFPARRRNCDARASFSAATFFSAAPSGLIIFALVTIKRKQFDLLMTLLVVLSGVFMFWNVLNFPAWLAKISMPGMSVEYRT